MTKVCPVCAHTCDGIKPHFCENGRALRFIPDVPNEKVIDIKPPIPTALTAPTGVKYDAQKARLDLVSPIALLELAKVLEFGSRKYNAHNWRSGIQFSRLIAACLRHVFSYLGGESKDPETGLSHLAHALCNLMFLLEFEVTRPDLDDRYKPAETKNKA